MLASEDQPEFLLTRHFLTGVTVVYRIVVCAGRCPGELKVASLVQVLPCGYRLAGTIAHKVILKSCFATCTRCLGGDLLFNLSLAPSVLTTSGSSLWLLTTFEMYDGCVPMLQVPDNTVGRSRFVS